jgi:hypothetical protein
MKIRTFAIAVLRAAALAALVAGCSSATGNPQPTYPLPTSPALQTAAVNFTVTLAGAAPASVRGRRPNYLSGGTQSVSILPIVPGSTTQTPAVLNLVAGAAGCTGSGPTLACTGTVKAPVGETSFTVTTYAGQNAKGAVLSVGTFALMVKASANAATLSNATSLALNGVPASLALAVTPQILTLGTGATLSATVTAFDAAGAIIIGPGQYTTGIALETITPASATDSVLSASGVTIPPAVPDCTYPIVPNVTYCYAIGSIAAPGTAIPLTYSGEFVSASSIQLAAESPGLATKAVTIALASPVPGSCSGSPVKVCPGSIVFASALSTPVPVTVSEPGVTEFQGQGSTCGASQTALIDNSYSGATGNAFTITAGLNPGSCFFIFSDAANNQTELNVTVLGAPPTATPSPSPTPVATDTPVPTGPVAIAPSNTLEFNGPTAPPQTFTASEAGVASFTLNQTACAGIVTVGPASGTAFTATPVSTLTQGGKCTISVLDPSLQFSYVKFYVDGTIITVDKR